MKFSLYQECYKLGHKKIVWIAPLVLLVLMVITGYSIGYNQSRLLMATCYDAPEWKKFNKVVVGATTYSMDFHNKAN